VSSTAHLFYPIQLILGLSMSWSVATRASSSAGAIAIALLTAQFCPRNLDGYALAFAEVICWGLVAILSGFLSRFQIVSWTGETMEVEPSIKYLHWILAASVTVVAALSSVVSSTWITVRFSYIFLWKAFQHTFDSPQSPLLSSLDVTPCSFLGCRNRCSHTHDTHCLRLG
jgi:hypothetical protein